MPRSFYSSLALLVVGIRLIPGEKLSESTPISLVIKPTSPPINPFEHFAVFDFKSLNHFERPRKVEKKQQAFSQWEPPKRHMPFRRHRW